jgi:hypothetical protein
VAMTTGAISRSQMSPEDADEATMRIMQKAGFGGKKEPRRLIVDLAKEEEDEEPKIVSDVKKVMA